MSPVAIRALGVAVIAIAWQDAIGAPASDGHTPPDVARGRARDWFRRAGRDFSDICAMAGLDPDAVRDRALAAMAQKDAEAAARCVRRKVRA